LRQSKDSASTKKETHAIALAKTCRAIRSECTQLFYATNTFVLHVDPNIGAYSVRQMVVEFHNGIGARNFSALRDFTVDFGDFTCRGWDGTPVMDLQHSLPSWLSALLPLPNVDAFHIRFSTSVDASSGTYHHDHELSVIKPADDWATISNKLIEKRKAMLSDAKTLTDTYACVVFDRLINYMKHNRPVVVDMTKRSSGKAVSERD
jgi:hypothetical protein